MAEPKTKATKASVMDFLKKVPDEQKRKDGLELLKIFKSVTGEKPVMWGPSMIGFGKYHYKSERSKQEGDWLITGFSPRKQALTLYLMLYNNTELDALLKKLGKHKRGGGCLYINKLADADTSVLKQMIRKTYVTMKKKYS